MGRYIGPICRLCRRNADKLMLEGDRCFSPKCAIDKRPKMPGQTTNRRRRVSERGLQLREKQKARFIYGLGERQFQRFFGRAQRQFGITGDNLVVLLERRLDNVVFRLGFADSRAQARQLVQHGHIMLNNHKTTIPSALVKGGDTISWRQGSTKTEYYKTLLTTIESKTVPNWLNLDRANLVANVVSLPTGGDVEAKFSGQSVVEYYSR